MTIVPAPSNTLIAYSDRPYLTLDTGSPEGVESWHALLKLDGCIALDMPAGLAYSARRLDDVRAELRADGWTPDDASALTARAQSWIRELFEDATRVRRPWIEPSISATPEGEIAFEWRFEERLLTCYVSTAVAYLQSWGRDMQTEMDEGSAETADTRQTLWRWITEPGLSSDA